VTGTWDSLDAARAPDHPGLVLEPVRVATSADAEAMTGVISAAFDADPLWSWAFPDPQRRPAQYARWWRLCVDGAQRFPWTWVAGAYAAVSVWLPPGEPELSPEQEAQVEPLITELLGAADAPRVLETLHRFEAARPTDSPHYYLSLLGTAPAQRGRGVGMALLADNLARVDADAAAAYLESTNPANLARYESVGFRRLGEFAAGGSGSPVVTTMWREPRTG